MEIRAKFSINSWSYWEKINGTGLMENHYQSPIYICIKVYIEAKKTPFRIVRLEYLVFEYKCK